ncbi:MAG TPA: DUF3341 domain-containing protein [Terriglobia bacterium]|nr:DUF3341 domain-containing protein [Terriglobia bacterium]
MAGKNTTVFGIYSTYAGVQSGTDALKNAGFRTTDIAALVPENQGSKDLAHERHSKAPEGIMKGVIIGGIIGGILGWLFGSGTVIIAGLDPLLVAGPVVATLAGVGALGILGFIIGGLTGLGAPEYEARRYRGRIKHGGLLLSVHCDDDREWAKRAKKTLKLSGAASISAAKEAGADYAGTDKPLPRTVTGGSPEL